MVEENQQNNDGEIFDVIFKQLNENKDEMIQWQKEELEEKYSLAMTCMKLDIEILAMKKGNNELDEKSNEEKEEFEDMLEELEEILDTKKILLEEHARSKTFREDMTARAVMMESLQRLQFDPKNDHHLKLINSVEKKIEGAKMAKNLMQKKQFQEITQKKGKLSTLKDELVEIGDNRAKMQQEIEKVETALSVEETYLTEVLNKIDEAQEIQDEIKKVQAETHRLEAVEEVEYSALDQTRVKIDNLHIRNIEFKEEIDDHKTKLKESIHQSTLLDEKLKDFQNLTLLIKSPKVSLKNLEANEIFQREYKNNPLFIEKKNKIQVKTKENKEIHYDLEKMNAEKLQKEQELEKIRDLLVNSETKKKSASDELNKLKSKELETQEKLKKRREKIRCADDDLQLKIRELKSVYVKEEGEIDELRSRYLTVIADLNMKLKLEEQKTAQAKERQRTAFKEKKAQSMVLNNVHAMSSSQAPLSKRQKIEEKSDISITTATRYQSTFGSSRRSIPTPVMSSSFETVPGTRSLPVTRKSAPAFVPVMEKIKPALKPTKKPALKIDEEAFSDDDDEFSFNITFNTDIEDLLDDSHVGF